jgi:hypothetical protein
MAAAAHVIVTMAPSYACDVNDVSGLRLRVRFKCYVFLATVPVNVTHL